MPTYTYATLNDDGTDGDLFEIEQGSSDTPLSVHPITKKKVRRIFSPISLTTRYSDGELKRKSSDKAYLESKGFARYERDAGTGLYHKTAGTNPEAPEVIDPKKS